MTDTAISLAIWALAIPLPWAIASAIALFGPSAPTASGIRRLSWAVILATSVLEMLLLAFVAYVVLFGLVGFPEDPPADHFITLDEILQVFGLGVAIVGGFSLRTTGIIGLLAGFIRVLLSDRRSDPADSS